MALRGLAKLLRSRIMMGPLDAALRSSIVLSLGICVREVCENKLDPEIGLSCVDLVFSLINLTQEHQVLTDAQGSFSILELSLNSLQVMSHKGNRGQKEVAQRIATHTVKLLKAETLRGLEDLIFSKLFPTILNLALPVYLNEEVVTLFQQGRISSDIWRAKDDPGLRRHILDSTDAARDTNWNLTVLQYCAFYSSPLPLLINGNIVWTGGPSMSITNPARSSLHSIVGSCLDGLFRCRSHQETNSSGYINTLKSISSSFVGSITQYPLYMKLSHNLRELPKMEKFLEGIWGLQPLPRGSHNNTEDSFLFADVKQCDFAALSQRHADCPRRWRSFAVCKESLGVFDGKFFEAVSMISSTVEEEADIVKLISSCLFSPWLTTELEPWFLVSTDPTRTENEDITLFQLTKDVFKALAKIFDVSQRYAIYSFSYSTSCEWFNKFVSLFSFCFGTLQYWNYASIWHNLQFMLCADSVGGGTHEFCAREFVLDIAMCA